MTALTLADIKRRYVIEGRRLDAATEAALRADTRAGAKAILDAIERRRFGNRSEGQRLRTLLRYEGELWAQGVLHVAGVDEAGMSPLAGPVSAAAVVFAPGSRIPGVDDSKKLDAQTRERLAGEIKATAVAWCVGFAEVDEIDTINIYWAGQLAMRRAVEGLSHAPQHVLTDARRIKDVHIPATPDRQRRLQEPDHRRRLHPRQDRARCTHAPARRTVSGLWFRQAQGLSRARASRRLKRLGASPIHRRSFAPVRAALGLPPLPPWPNAKEASV